MPDSPVPGAAPGPAGRTLWEEGHEPGRQVVALAAALALSGVVIDVAVGGDLGLLFDLAFVGLCVVVALLVRPRDFFTVGVLPPLLMLGVLVLLEVTHPSVLGEPRDGAVQSVVTGLAHHATALVVGYVLCLAVLAVRHRFVARRRLPQAVNLPGSPAPTRNTSG